MFDFFIPERVKMFFRRRKEVARLRIKCQSKGIPTTTAAWVTSARKAGGDLFLGEGGYGSVCLARDPDHCRTKLVVKNFLSDEMADCMLHEAEALRKVRGVPGLQRLYAVCPETCTLVSHYGGDTLQNIIRKSSLTELDAVEVARQLVVAVDGLHQRELCHNDIKVDNVCVTRTKRGRVKVTLIDLGLCTPFGTQLVEEPVLDPEERSYWVAPEVYTGSGVSPTTDIYSVGVLLRLVFGRRRLKGWVKRARSKLPHLRPSLQEALEALDDLERQLCAPVSVKSPLEEEGLAGVGEGGGQTLCLHNSHEPQHLGSSRARKRSREDEDTILREEKRCRLEPP